MTINILNELVNALRTIISWIPEIIAFIIILLISYFFAWLVKKIVVGILHGIKLNQLVFKASYGETIRRLLKDPSRSLGTLAYWIIFLFGISLAVLSLKVDVLSRAVFAVYGYFPNLLAAILILLFALMLAGGSSALVKKLMGDTPTGRITGTILPALIMTLSVFMILVQLKIATSIVIITYIALVGALSVAFAIAFGWGGIDTAKRLLELAYAKGQENAPKAYGDIKRAGQRGREENERLKHNRNY